LHFGVSGTIALSICIDQFIQIDEFINVIEYFIVCRISVGEKKLPTNKYNSSVWYRFSASNTYSSGTQMPRCRIKPPKNRTTPMANNAEMVKKAIVTPLQYQLNI
jgi:hypothetical protein